MYVYINGIEYRALRDFTITEQTGNKTLSTISVLVESQPVPVAGDVIELKDDSNNTIFWGTCGIPKSPKYNTGHEMQIYEISCNNANSILANRIINVAYQGYTISEIVTDLYDKYISAENITVGLISDVPIVVEVYTASDFNLQTSLNELADLVGATWRIDNDHKFYFLAEEDFPKFPYEINEEFLLGTALQEKTKDYQTRTVQYIAGATEYTSLQTESFVFEDQNEIITVFPLSQRPTIYINGTQVPSNRIGINGIDDDRDEVIFSFTFNSQIISIKDKEAIPSGATIRVDYYGIFPIRVVARNEQKIIEVAELTGTSGLREKVYIATDVTTMADAQALARSLLSQFSQASKELSFWLLSSQLEALGMSLDDTEVLTQMTFNIPFLHIEGTFVIVERKLQVFSADETDYKITLKLRDRDYLKSYGETISSLNRAINQLLVRENENVITQENIIEVKELTERTQANGDIPLFCTVSIVNGSLFSGFDFDGVYYPVQGAGKIIDFVPYYPSAGDEIFQPVALGVDVYPI